MLLEQKSFDFSSPSQAFPIDSAAVVCKSYVLVAASISEHGCVLRSVVSSCLLPGVLPFLLVFCLNYLCWAVFCLSSAITIFMLTKEG
jgi:hypothetical protein